MKYLKKLFIGLLLGAIILSSTSCVGPHAQSKKEAAARGNVQNVDNLMGSNLKDTLAQLSSLSYGVGYSLSKEENPSKAVEIAMTLNERAISLTGQPSIDEVKKMKQMIDDLTSQLATERERGKVAMELKDTEIADLQAKAKLLAELKDKEIQKYMKIAADTAAKADELQVKVDKMDSFFGLGAIWYGVKKFVFSSAWILGIGSILFLVLRFASLSNPIAASVFAIFNQMGAWVVNIIKIIVPKAVDMAGHVTTDLFNSYRTTMTKMIDGIETLKERQKAIGDPNKKYTLDEVLTEFSKMLDSNEKAMVQKIKRDIGYNG